MWGVSRGQGHESESVDFQNNMSHRQVFHDHPDLVHVHLQQLSGGWYKPSLFPPSVIEACFFVHDSNTADGLFTTGKCPFDHAHRLCCCNLLLFPAWFLRSCAAVDGSALSLLSPVMTSVLSVHLSLFYPLRDLVVSGNCDSLPHRSSATQNGSWAAHALIHLSIAYNWANHTVRIHQGCT